MAICLIHTNLDYAYKYILTVGINVTTVIYILAWFQNQPIRAENCIWIWQLNFFLQIVYFCHVLFFQGRLLTLKEIKAASTSSESDECIIGSILFRFLFPNIYIYIYILCFDVVCSIYILLFSYVGKKIMKFSILYYESC